MRGDPRIALSDAWASCLASDRVDELVALADTIPRRCHPKQRDCVIDTSRRVIVRCGGRAGKTTAAMFRLLRTLLTTPDAHCLFLASNREQAKQLIWDALKVWCADLNVAVKASEDDLVCRMLHNQAWVKLDGVDDSKSVEKFRGIPWDLVIIDECASIKPSLLNNLFYRILEPRLADRGGTIVFQGTPGHVLAGPFYELSRTGTPEALPYEERAGKPDWTSWTLHHWCARDAAEAGLPVARRIWDAFLEMKANNGWSDDNPIWQREYLGNWVRDNTQQVYAFRPYLDDGAAWNTWDPVCKDGWAKLPDHLKDVSYVIGIDFGFADPFAVVVMAYSLNDPTKTLYQVYEFAQRGLNIRQMAEHLLGPQLDLKKPGGVYGRIGWPTAVVGDASSQAVFKELAEVYGIRITPAPRRPGDKLAAIEAFNGDLIDGRIKALKGSKLAEQLAALQWVMKEDGTPQEDQGAENDVADAALMARGVAKHLRAAAPAEKAIEQRDPAEYPTPQRLNVADDWADMADDHWNDDAPYSPFG